MVACVWTIYANVLGASIYPTMGSSGFETIATMSPMALAKRSSSVAETSFANTSIASTSIASTSVAMIDPPRLPQGPAATFEERMAGLLERPSVAPAAQDSGQIVAQAVAPKPAIPAPPPLVVAELKPNVPMPTAKPAEIRLAPAPAKPPSAGALAQNSKPAVVAAAASAKQNIFEKLFGKVEQKAGALLAFAPTDGGVTGDGQDAAAPKAGLYDRLTAVYDISARTVYMPDGTKLEAHSGLGSMLDDPRHVRERMRGATPPHTYDLAMREALFHGVPALRLKPVGGEGAIFGRSGLLAHTYMLGPNGDSNGCVSFKNYDAFVSAFRNNRVKRLVVVAKLD